MLEYDESRNAVTAQLYGHTHEVWGVAPSPSNPAMLATCYSDSTSSRAGKGRRASLWRIPSSTVPRDGRAHPDLEHVVEFAEGESSMLQVLWPVHGGRGLATVEESGFRIWGVEGGAPKVIGAVPASELPRDPIAAGCWDPHSPCVVALAAGTSISLVDTRSMQRGLVNEAAHVMPARDVQFNPKRPHALASCGDGCKIKFWDARSMVAPLLELSGHTHWVWQARYNPAHDQLVLSCSSDTQVALWMAETASSVAGSAHDGPEAAADGQVALFDEHEDSAYAVAWSACPKTPFVFASTSYDGSVHIQAVPRAVKYRCLL